MIKNKKDLLDLFYIIQKVDLIEPTLFVIHYSDCEITSRRPYFSTSRDYIGSKDLKIQDHYKRRDCAQVIATFKFHSIPFPVMQIFKASNPCAAIIEKVLIILLWTETFDFLCVKRYLSFGCFKNQQPIFITTIRITDGGITRIIKKLIRFLYVFQFSQHETLCHLAPCQSLKKKGK
uniref:Uncharacterized protein n=1 Tax=Glossina palpalis gambiensis TaxID=67801 RepID=A0A1B0BLC0_9MUSC